MQIVTNAYDMPELIAWADVAVTAGGSTCWEMALLGLPNIIIYFANNQRPIADKLHEIGAVMSLGWHHKLTTDRLSANINFLLVSGEVRRKYTETSRSIVDGAGAVRVCQAIMGLS